MPLDKLRDRAIAAAAVGVCPAKLRPELVTLFTNAFDSAPVASLAAFAEALWRPSWIGASTAAIRGALAMGDFDCARRVVGLHDLAPALEKLVRRGHDGVQFFGRIEDAAAYEPSMPLALALLEHGYFEAAERMVPRRAIAPARAAAAMRFESIACARMHVRSIRDKSVRAQAAYRVALAAPLEQANALVDEIGTHLLRQRARLELARRWYERGERREALRNLRQVRDPRLHGARDALVAELRLVLRPERECGMLGSPDIVYTSLLLRFALRRDDDYILGDAAKQIRKLQDRRALLVLWERAGICVGAALLALQRRDNGRAIDRLMAEHAVMRAERLPEPCAPIVTASADIRSLDRALADEQVALSPEAPQRRRVLIAAGQHALRSAFTQPETWTRDVVETRLRMLVHLGGELGRDTIAKALTTLPFSTEYALDAIEALCAIDPAVATSIVVARMTELRAAGVDVSRALQILEIYGGVPRGFTHALDAARGTVARATPDPDLWLVQLAAQWHDRTARTPDLALLDWIAKRDDVPASPAALLAELEHVTEVVRGDHYFAAATRSAADDALLDTLLLARPARIASTMLPWTSARWRTHMAEATSTGASRIDPAIARRCARLLQRPAAPIVAGDLTQLGVPAVIAVDDRWRVRLLDRRDDLLTYLRFADIAAWSCYRSDSKFFDHDEFTTRHALMEVWKDPLAFCFHVERHRDAWRPAGFCFGGFIEVEGRIAIAMSSLHVHPNDPEVRIAIIDAIEDALCTPLGVTLFGIANMHGGYGVLPPDFVFRTVTLTRLRALARADGTPVVSAYDDLGCAANVRETNDELYWRAR